MSDHAHTPEGADDCFGCKMAYMRANGSLAVHYPYGGRAAFSGPTIRERQQKIIDDAAKQGRSVRLVNPTYDRGPAAFADPKRGGPMKSAVASL